MVSIVFFFTLGGGGEGGVPAAGSGQDSVTVRHEEAPENFAHVFWSSLRRSDEGLWAGALFCSQGKNLVFVCLYGQSKMQVRLDNHINIFS